MRLGILVSGVLLCRVACAQYAHAQQPPVRAESAPPNVPQKFGDVSVAGVSVAGLNSAQATQRLRRELKKKLDAPHVLTDGKKSVTRRRRDLGVGLDIGQMLGRAGRGDKVVPLALQINSVQLQRALRRVSPNFKRQSRDARVVLARGKTIIVPETNKQAMNIAVSTRYVAAQIEKHPERKMVHVALYSKPPALTASRLKGINGVIGTYSTDFNAAKVKRTNNMRIGIKAIDGTLLSPGEVFSLNKTVGERTQARGYRTTVIFQSGYKVSGLGGGISQVTGTIFNAALLAGLPISTYKTHSRSVAYIPLGRDATVAWNQFDMKFKNNTGAPIYVSYKIGDSVTATLFGKKTNQRVALRVVSKAIGPREIKAQLYRKITRNGKTVTQKIGNSHYKWNQADWEAE